MFSNQIDDPTTFTTIGNDVFVGTTRQGIIKISSNGIHTYLNRGLPVRTSNNVQSYGSIRKLVLLEGNLYASVAPFDLLNESLIYRSINNGESWQPIKNGFTSSDIASLPEYIAGPWAIGSDLYFATQFGLLKLPNNSNSWQRIRTLPISCTDLVGTKDSLFAISEKSLYNTTDGGFSWYLVKRFRGNDDNNGFRSLLFSDNKVYVGNWSRTNEARQVDVYNLSGSLLQTLDHDFYGAEVLKIFRGYLYAGTSNRWIHRIAISQETIIEDLPLSLSVSESGVISVLRAGESQQYTLTARDNRDAPVPDAIISVQDPMSPQVQTIRTSSQGTANYTVTVPTNTTIGTYTLRFTAIKAGFAASNRVERVVEVQGMDASISLSTNRLDFGVTRTNTASVRQYRVQASNIPSRLRILSSSTAFRISTEQGAGFSDELNITPRNGRIDTTIFVRFLMTISGRQSVELRHQIMEDARAEQQLTLRGASSSDGSTQLFTISGQIIGNGLDVSRVEVNANGTTAYSDNQGRYVIDSLPNGAYNVTAFRQGSVFTPRTTATVIQNGNVQNINFQMSDSASVIVVGGGAFTVGSGIDAIELMQGGSVTQVFQAKLGDTPLPNADVTFQMFNGDKSSPLIDGRTDNNGYVSVTFNIGGSPETQDDDFARQDEVVAVRCTRVRASDGIIPAIQKSAQGEMRIRITPRLVYQNAGFGYQVGASASLGTGLSATAGPLFKASLKGQSLSAEGFGGAFTEFSLIAANNTLRELGLKRKCNLGVEGSLKVGTELDVELGEVARLKVTPIQVGGGAKNQIQSIQSFVYRELSEQEKALFAGQILETIILGQAANLSPFVRMLINKARSNNSQTLKMNGVFDSFTASTRVDNTANLDVVKVNFGLGLGDDVTISDDTQFSIASVQAESIAEYGRERFTSQRNNSTILRKFDALAGSINFAAISGNNLLSGDLYSTSSYLLAEKSLFFGDLDAKQDLRSLVLSLQTGSNTDDIDLLKTDYVFFGDALKVLRDKEFVKTPISSSLQTTNSLLPALIAEANKSKSHYEANTTQTKGKQTSLSIGVEFGGRLGVGGELGLKFSLQSIFQNSFLKRRNAFTSNISVPTRSEFYTDDVFTRSKKDWKKIFEDCLLALVDQTKEELVAFWETSVVQPIRNGTKAVKDFCSVIGNGIGDVFVRIQRFPSDLGSGGGKQVARYVANTSFVSTATANKERTATLASSSEVKEVSPVGDMYLVRFENAQGRLASISTPAQISLIVSDSALVNAGFSSSDRNRLRLYWVAVDTTQQTVEISTRIVGDSVIGMSQLSGAYFAGIAIPPDTISPEIISSNLVNNPRVQHLPIFWMQVKDIQSGINPTLSTIMINDVPQSISYRPDLGQFTVERPTNVRSGQNVISVSIHDRAGNVVQSAFTFIISSTASIQSPLAIRPITPVQTSVNTPVSSRIILDGNATVFSASSSNPALIPPTNVSVSGTGTERTMTITPAPNQTGNAQITLTASNGSQNASQTFSVSVGAGQALQTGFRLLTPQNRATNISPASITFRWASAPSSSFYNFQIATDPSFIHTLLNEHYTDTTQTFTGFHLNRWYFWRVRPLGGDWSPVWSFYTGTLSTQTAPFSNTTVQNASAQLSSQIPSTIRQSYQQNNGEYLNVLTLTQHPNPFSHTTTLEYLLPRDANVRMDICNMLGQTLITPVHGREEAGLHSVNVEMNSFPSGVYVVRLNVGGEVLTRQMTLIH